MEILKVLDFICASSCTPFFCFLISTLGWIGVNYEAGNLDGFFSDAGLDEGPPLRGGTTLIVSGGCCLATTIFGSFALPLLWFFAVMLFVPD